MHSSQGGSHELRGRGRGALGRFDRLGQPPLARVLELVTALTRERGARDRDRVAPPPLLDLLGRAEVVALRVRAEAVGVEDEEERLAGLAEGYQRSSRELESRAEVIRDVLLRDEPRAEAEEESSPRPRAATRRK